MTNPASAHQNSTDVLSERFATLLERIELGLTAALPDDDRLLPQAMRYAVLGGGKRIRPLLVHAAAHALQVPTTHVDAIGVAVEIIHAYSLVHDDLPAMDNDDLRRGHPTCHRQFDEATAILAGDALQALAFEVLAEDPFLATNAGAQAAIMGALAQACGARGMAGGQALDLAAVGKILDSDQLKAMHRLKTGALIRFSVLAPTLLTSAPENTVNQLDRYGERIGLAFQIHDDVLDETGDPHRLGKPIASDRAHAKPTFAGVLGLDRSRRLAGQLRDEALACVQPFGTAAEDLAFLARYAVERQR